MKKLLITLIIFFSISNKSYSMTDYVECEFGNCKFFIGLFYKYVETNCFDLFLFHEEVDVEMASFTIKKNNKKCIFLKAK